MSKLSLTMSKPKALALAACVGLSGCGGQTNPALQPPSTTSIQASNYPSFDAALAACPATGSCIVSVPAGIFATSHYGQNCVSRSNTAVVGAGQPAYDLPNAPTMLVGGTILQPSLQFCGASNVTVSDLGIDDGPAYVAAGGPTADGLVYDGADDPNPADPLWTNNSAERVTSLGSSNRAAFHAFRFEHGSGLTFDGLRATYDIHCLAIKASSVTGGAVTTQACSSDGVVVKSDDYTTVSNVSIASVSAKSLIKNDSQNGVVFASGALLNGNSTSAVQIGSIETTGMYSAITFLADGAVGDGAINHVTINALMVSATQVNSGPDCVQSTATAGQTFQYLTISNVQCVNNTGSGGFPAMRLYSPVFNTRINNWTTQGQVNAAYLDGSIVIDGWNNGGAGAPEPTFYLIGGTATNIQLSGYVNTVPGSSLYTSDGAGETLEVTTP